MPSGGSLPPVWVLGDVYVSAAGHLTGVGGSLLPPVRIVVRVLAHGSNPGLNGSIMLASSSLDLKGYVQAFRLLWSPKLLDATWLE